MKYLEQIHDQICKKIRTVSDVDPRILELYQNFILESNYFLCNNIMKSYLDNFERQRIFQKIDVIISKMDKDNQNYHHLKIKEYKSLKVEGIEASRKTYKCEFCGGSVQVDPNNSELVCRNCQNIVVIKGMIFDNTQVYSHDGSIIKRGSYESLKHCKEHLEKILIEKPFDIPESVNEKILEWLKVNKKNPKVMSCQDWRVTLKELKFTKYNKYIPFIRKNYGGPPAGHLYNYEKEKIYMYFDKLIKAIEILKVGKDNINHYPYFILKLLELILSGKNDKVRLQNIVDCIHIQSNNTVGDHDDLWKKICALVPEFTYKKTDRNMLYS